MGNIVSREKIAIEAVRLAGKDLRERFGAELQTETKFGISLVSEADKSAEKIILSLIGQHFPKDGILSEESQERAGESGFRWIIDPLDGTHSFLAGFWEFGCGLAIEKENEVIFGVCYFPMYDELFWAEKNAGAFCNNKRIWVSRVDNLRGQMFFPDSAVRLAPSKTMRDIARFTEAGCRLRVYGSLHFTLTRVARGQGAVVASRVAKPWDIAPAAIIVKEAGGKVTDEKGDPWHLISKNILATNGLVHDVALLLFR